MNLKIPIKDTHVIESCIVCFKMALSEIKLIVYIILSTFLCFHHLCVYSLLLCSKGNVCVGPHKWGEAREQGFA